MIGYLSPLGNDATAMVDNIGLPALTLSKALSFGGDVELLDGTDWDAGNLIVTTSPGHTAEIRPRAGSTVLMDAAIEIVSWTGLTLTGATFNGGMVIIGQACVNTTVQDCVWQNPVGDNAAKAIRMRVDGATVPQNTIIRRNTFNGPFAVPPYDVPFVLDWGEGTIWEKNRVLNVHCNGVNDCLWNSKECPEAIRKRAGGTSIYRKNYYEKLHKQSCFIRILPTGGDSPAINLDIYNEIFYVPDKGPGDLYDHSAAIDIECTSATFDEKRPTIVVRNCTAEMVTGGRRAFELDEKWKNPFPGRPNPVLANNLVHYIGGGSENYCDRSTAVGNVCRPSSQDPPCDGWETANWSVDEDFRPPLTRANEDWVIGKADPAYAPVDDHYGDIRS